MMLMNANATYPFEIAFRSTCCLYLLLKNSHSVQNYVEDLLNKEECFVIVGLCMKVHSKLGRGFKEIVYKDALEVELYKNKIEYEREKSFNILYEGIILPHYFNADFLVYKSIILEIKAASNVYPDNFRQT